MNLDVLGLRERGETVRLSLECWERETTKLGALSARGDEACEVETRHRPKDHPGCGYRETFCYWKARVAELRFCQ